MLKPATFTFLKQLEKPKNNSKAWMDRNRPAADAAIADVRAFADRLIREVAKFDARIAEAQPSGKDCVTRLNRDVRFNGGPIYKHEFHVVLNHRGKKAPTAFYYVHIAPGRASVGGGVYNPESRSLYKYREGLSERFARFDRLVKNKSFRSDFPAGVEGPEKGKRMPRGFDEDDPAAEFLKLKGFFVKAKVDGLTREANFKKIVRLLRSAKPLVEFLNDVYESGTPVKTSRKPNPLYPR